ncbi:zinc transporter ZIP14 [Trichonephila clavipes]|nr:zinc transporter ZIP14 [Trichonephila clavipes]
MSQDMAVPRRFRLLITLTFLFCTYFDICRGEQQFIDSLDILESLSHIALLRHHPQSAFSTADNVSESFASLLEDLHKQNLTDMHSNLNCSSLSQYPLLPKNLCNDGTLFKKLSEGRFDLSTFRSERTNEASMLTIPPKRSSSRDVGHDSLMVKIMDSWLACHEFEPSITGLVVCMSASDMLELVPQSTKSVSEALARLCPLLLLQLHNSACSAPISDQSTSLKPSSLAVWGYGLLFVTIISCCSLVGVIILPLLSKNVYQVVLMLFEGLAVGSLVGSSLFHLIPQRRLTKSEIEKRQDFSTLTNRIFVCGEGTRLTSKIAIDVKGPIVVENLTGQN